MRTREQIEHDAKNARYNDEQVFGSSNNTSEQILEVLLDIRDLMEAEKR